MSKGCLHVYFLSGMLDEHLFPNYRFRNLMQIAQANQGSLVNMQLTMQEWSTKLTKVSDFTHYCRQRKSPSEARRLANQTRSVNAQYRSRPRYSAHQRCSVRRQARR